MAGGWPAVTWPRGLLSPPAAVLTQRLVSFSVPCSVHSAVGTFADKGDRLVKGVLERGPKPMNVDASCLPPPVHPAELREQRTELLECTKGCEGCDCGVAGHFTKCGSAVDIKTPTQRPYSAGDLFNLL